MDANYDLTVIGAGPGGYEAAIRAAQLGLNVAVIEEKDLGGTCLNWGCIPTKSLLHSAEIFQMAIHSEAFGVQVGSVSFDYGKIAQRKDTVVEQLRYGVESLLKSNGVKIIRGRAIFVDPHTIEIDGPQKQLIQSNKTIIATGSRTFKPPIPGIDGSQVLDSDGVLALKTCPDRIIIMGGGVIGVEFATVFSNLGKNVIIIEMMDRILPGIDHEIAALTRQSLEKKGIEIHTSAKVLSIQTSEVVSCSFIQNDVEKQVSGDLVIVAIGRKPNTENLGLQKIGVKMDRGYIQIDETMETSVPGIYAIGDITGKVQLAHFASAQGLVAAGNAAGKSQRLNSNIVPGCIYTSPEIASVGMTETEAAQTNRTIKIGRFPVSANGKSLISGETEGLVKIITDHVTGEILGAHIMASRATDMIGEIAVAMNLESTIEEISETIHPHPTYIEMLKEAAHDVEDLCINKPRVKKK